eukprot:UN00352
MLLYVNQIDRCKDKNGGCSYLAVTSRTYEKFNRNCLGHRIHEWIYFLKHQKPSANYNQITYCLQTTTYKPIPFVVT